MDHPSLDDRLPLTKVDRRSHLAVPRLAKGQKALTEVFARAGITFGGNEPWDMRILDERFYARALSQGSMGLGESYIEGWWECDRVDEMAVHVLNASSEESLKRDWRLVLSVLSAKYFNLQTMGRSGEVAKVHYDLGNSFFQRMLGKSMQYSCARWNNATTLDEAQTNKLDLICKKLDLRRGETLLDIGCGWGGLARHAAEHYGCTVTGITISERQFEYAREWCRGLPVTIRLTDYRAPAVAELGPFDKIVSVGMFEHVGEKNYAAYMAIVHRLLKDRGLFLLQSIGHQSSIGFDPWINKYIFPNSRLPSANEITRAITNMFVMEDWQNVGADYDRTLMAWHTNFEAFAASDDFPYDRRFYRMWRYYLLVCAGVFRVRWRTQLWQIALSKGGVPGGYASAR
jgi:cyclopropane-fatty-acyl-phospholipid synthase